MSIDGVQVPGYRSISQFRKLTKLIENKSTSCTIWRAECTITNEIVVLKDFSKSSMRKREIVHMHRETSTMRMVSEVNGVVKWLGHFEDELSYYIVMEYCAGGDLFSVLENKTLLDEPWVVKAVIAPLVFTLASLHNRNIIHRDIKPENLLLDRAGNLKLADFGMSIDQSKERPFLLCGTLEFMAPEVVTNPADSFAIESPHLQHDLIASAGYNVYNEKVDIWSVGALAYELIVGIPPFTRTTKLKTAEAICQGTWHVPEEHQHRMLWRSFLNTTLRVNPNDRPTAADLLRDPWIVRHIGHQSIPPSFQRPMPPGLKQREKDHHLSIPSPFDLKCRENDRTPSFEDINPITPIPSTVSLRHKQSDEDLLDSLLTL